MPSACWKASKISFSLSSEIPIPLSATSNCTTLSAFRSVASPKRVSEGAGDTVSVTLPLSVNLNAFERRFFSTCWRRCSSVTIDAGSPALSLASNTSSFWSATGRNVRST